MCYNNNMDKYTAKFKRGFTLAEVLITLVIVGIIAAMTIPAVIAAYKKQEIESRLRKAYSTFANGIKLSEVANGPFSGWPTAADIGNVENYWKIYFAPFFSGAKLCSNSSACGYKSDLSGSKWQNMNWSIITSDTRMFFVLGDGTTIFYPINTTDINGNPAYTTILYIDVNGTKEPNTYCKDVFPFNRDYNKNTIVPIDCTIDHLKRVGN